MKIMKFVVGAVAGALAGIAFAPKKGSKLREEVIEGFKHSPEKGKKALVDNAKLVGEDISKTAKDVYDDPNVQKQIKKAKVEAEKGIKEVKAQVMKHGKQLQKMATKKFQDIKKKLVDDKSAAKTQGKASTKSKSIKIKKG